MKNLEINRMVKGYRVRLVIENLPGDFVEEYREAISNDVASAIRLALNDYEYTKLYLQKKQ